MTLPQERTVTRTYRAAIRLGEDFITLEETITLPLNATPEEIQAAVDLGWQIYQAQRASLDAQVRSIREAAPPPPPPLIRDPDAPASDKQRSYIAALQEDLSWSPDQMAGYARDHGIDLITLTKGQASSFIDGLKRLAEERTRYGDGRARAVAEPALVEPEPATPATERQLRALARVARERGLNLEAELVRRFQHGAERLTAEQASALLTEWQRPTRQPQHESAL